MKLLLHVDVPKLGYFGDVVEVAEGYGRNYLVPQGLAVEPTEANVKTIEADRAHKAEERRLVREQLERAAEKVNGAEITITARANEQGHLFGSVTEEHIAEALRDQGFEIQNKHVVLPEHLRMLGDYGVKLQFGPDLGVVVKLGVVRPTDQEDDAPSEPETE